MLTAENASPAEIIAQATTREGRDLIFIIINVLFNRIKTLMAMVFQPLCIFFRSGTAVYEKNLLAVESQAPGLIESNDNESLGKRFLELQTL